MSVHSVTISVEEARIKYGIEGTHPIILSGPKENLTAAVVDNVLKLISAHSNAKIDIDPKQVKSQADVLANMAKAMEAHDKALAAFYAYCNPLKISYRNG